MPRKEPVCDMIQLQAQYPDLVHGHGHGTFISAAMGKVQNTERDQLGTAVR